MAKKSGVPRWATVPCTFLILAAVVGKAAAGQQAGDCCNGVAAGVAQVLAAEAPERVRGRNALGIDVGLSVLREAWNLNERRESMAGATFSVWWAFRQRAALTVQLHSMRVFQFTPRDAFVHGVTFNIRWEARKPDPWGVFVDIGPGLSWSDTAVPPRGTRFNYLVVAGAGLSRQLGRQRIAFLGLRWIHLSNNGRMGNDRNPDIEALGPFVGLRVAL